MQTKIMLVNQHGACVLAYARKLKNFNFFGASDAGRVNSLHLYTLAEVLRVYYQTTYCLHFILLAFIKLASFVFHSVWISMLAVDIRLLACSIGCVNWIYQKSLEKTTQWQQIQTSWPPQTCDYQALMLVRHLVKKCNRPRRSWAEQWITR